MGSNETAPTEQKRKKKNRAAGEGTLYFDDKRKLWIGELMVGYKPDGKADKRRVTSKQQGDARKKLDALKARAASGMLGDAAAGRETVAAFLRHWLESIDGTMEKRSLQRHRDNVGRYLIPALGSRKLADIKPANIVTLMATLRTRPVVRGQRAEAKDAAPAPKTEPTGKPLSPRSVKYCYTTLRRALDVAVEWGCLPRNPVRAVPVPTVPRVEIAALTPDEVGKLLESADAASDRHGPLFTVAVFSGLRLGELLALRWSDVDLATGRLSVRRSLRRSQDGKPDFREGGKTTRARRSLKLSPDAVAALRSQRALQAADRLVLGCDYAEYGLIFATPLGTPLDPSNVRKRLKESLARAELPDSYTFHSLRHSAATMMLAAGIDARVAADRLGHHSAAFTLDRYVHAVRSLDDEAADRLQTMVSAARKRAV